MTRGPALHCQLLATASRVFYERGIHSTSMDEMSAAAGVTKRTLYHHFPTKDALVEESLSAGIDDSVEAILASGKRAAAQGRPPRDQIVAVFAALPGLVGTPGFRGCPYLNASAEYQGDDAPPHAIAREQKERLRCWFEDTAHQADLSDARLVSVQLSVLLDGVLARAQIGLASEAAASSAEAAVALLGAAS